MTRPPIRLRPLPPPCTHASLATYFIWHGGPSEELEVRYSCTQCGLRGNVRTELSRLAPEHTTFDDYLEDRDHARLQIVQTVRALLLSLPFDAVHPR